MVGFSRPGLGHLILSWKRGGGDIVFPGLFCSPREDGSPFHYELFYFLVYAVFVDHDLKNGHFTAPVPHYYHSYQLDQFILLMEFLCCVQFQEILTVLEVILSWRCFTFPRTISYVVDIHPLLQWCTAETCMWRHWFWVLGAIYYYLGCDRFIFFSGHNKILHSRTGSVYFFFSPSGWGGVAN